MIVSDQGIRYWLFLQSWQYYMTSEQTDMFVGYSMAIHYQCNVHTMKTHCNNKAKITNH